MRPGNLDPFWRALLALLILFRRKAHGEFQLHSGVLVKSLALHPVESIYPVHFDFELPTYLPRPEILYNVSEIVEFDEFLNVTSALTDSENLLETLVKFYWETENSQLSPSRQKRSFEFIGDFFSWCCELTTHSELFPAGNAARLNLKSLNSEITHAFKAVASNNDQLKNYTRSVKSFFLAMSQKVNNIQHALLENHDKFLLNKVITIFRKILSQEYIMINMLNANSAHEIISACNNNKLSPLLIAPADLKKALLDLQITIHKAGFHFAIPLSDIMQYYLNSLTNCNREDEHLSVQLKIPLISNATSWTLFSLKPIAFAHCSQTCKINVIPEVAVGIPSDGSAHLYFSIERRPTDTLAMISDTPLSTATKNCVRALISPRVTLEALKSFCTFECENKNDLVVQRTGNRDFILTYSHNLHIDCNNKTQFLTNSTKGAVLINVPCNCSLQSNSSVIIRTVYPCLTGHENVTFKHLIPQHWTQLPNSIYISHLGAFPNLSAILDPIWAEDLPELNLISPEITEFDWDIFPKIMAYASNIHYFTLILIGYILFRNPQLLTGPKNDRPVQFVRMPPAPRKRNVRAGANRQLEIESEAPSHKETQTQI